MSSCSCQGAATPRPLRTSISSFCLRATAAACLAATSAAASVLGAGVVRAGCPLLASLRASLRARADAPPLLLLGVSCLPRSGARPWELAIHSRTWMWTHAVTGWPRAGATLKWRFYHGHIDPCPHHPHLLLRPAVCHLPCARRTLCLVELSRAVLSTTCAVYTCPCGRARYLVSCHEIP